MDVRKIFYYLFSERWFFCERLFFPSRFLFFKYVTWRFSPCGRIYFFFCLDTKEKETKRKNQGYVSGSTPERPFWRWKMNSLRCTTLRQHFSAPPGHSYAHAPTTRPILFSRQGASLLALAFWFYNATVSTPALIHFAVGFDGILFLVQLSWVYRIENSVFSHGILYT